MPIDKQAIGCDMLTAKGRKFLRAPRGTGFLYMRRDLIQQTEPAMIDLFGAEWSGPDRYILRPDARRFESWESDYAARAGLGVAIEYALELGLDRIATRNRYLSSHLRAGLADIDGVKTFDLGRELASIVTFAIDCREANGVAALLASQGINVSVSVPSSTLMDSIKRGLPSLVRISPHYYNTVEEIDRLLDIVRGLTRR